MENGKWKTENGKWKMENGKWKMENGKWKMENGKWKMENVSLILTFFALLCQLKKISQFFTVLYFKFYGVNNCYNNEYLL